MRVQRARRSTDRSSVSVIIPCYNYGNYLPMAVSGALNQPNVDVEVIVVDDASPDGSLSVANELADKYSNVQVIENERNVGHLATYNRGLAAATGDFVALVSADDVIAPGALSRASDLMRYNASVGMVYGRTLPFSGAVPHTDARTPAWWSVFRGHQWIEFACRRGRNFILSPEVLMRTSALRQVGYFRSDLPHSGDLELWLRIAARWDVGRVNGPFHAYYREHDKNMHLTTFATMSVDLRHRMSAFKALASDSSDTEMVDWISRARKALAREALVLARRGMDAGQDRTEVDTLINVALEIDSSALRSTEMRRLAKHPTRKRPVWLAGTRIVESARWRAWQHVGFR